MAGLVPFLFVEPPLQAAPSWAAAAGLWLHSWTAGETIGQAYPTVQLLCVELYIADCWEERESKICFLEAQMIQAT